MSTDYRQFPGEFEQTEEDLRGPQRSTAPGKVTLTRGLTPLSSGSQTRSQAIQMSPAPDTSPTHSVGYLTSELPGSTRSRMESAYSHSFNDVRVHENSSEASGNTHAVTRGRDLHFAEGRYQPGTQGGDWLIAHELAHVVQQARSSVAAQPFSTTGGLDVREVEADRAATAAVSGQRADILLGASYGQPQRYEAWEHIAAGNSHGGDQRTVTLPCGEVLTFGQLAALSGDFYRSPEALYNAPASEIRTILAAMGREQSAVTEHDKNPNAPGADERLEGRLAGVNADYEMATTDHDRRRDGQDPETFGAEGDESHGRVVEGEHVESAGAGSAVPSGQAGFMDLAQENAAHFSPDNIKHNYRPKHQLALDLGHDAWQERNRGRSAAPMSSSTAPANRDTSAPGQPALPGENTPAPSGAAEPRLAQPTDADNAPDARAGNADARSTNPGDQKEAQAWISEGFSTHFLHDGFAGGHLISGTEGRAEGAKYFQAHNAEIRTAFATCLILQYPQMPAALASTAAGAMLAAVSGLDKAGSIALKVVHDELNAQGVKVKNAKGTEWMTAGERALLSPDNAGARAQLELATVATRESLQDVIDTGTTSRAFDALDFLPDVAQFGAGTYMPIAEFAAYKSNQELFDSAFHRGMCIPDPASNALWRMASKDAAPMLQTYVRRAQRLAGRARDTVVSAGRSIWNWGSNLVDRAGRGLRSAGEAVRNWGSERVQDARDLGNRAVQGARDVRDRVVQGARETGESIWNWGRDKVDQVQRGAKVLREGAGRALGDAQRVAGQVWTRARRAVGREVAEQIDQLEEGRQAPQPDQLSSGEAGVTPLNNQTYAHGGFMGAAGTFMQNPKWNDIFSQLMPAKYREAKALTDLARLMSCLENNPVLAAYGSARHLSEVEGQREGEADPNSAKPLPLEWDVFLDPTHPEDLNRVRIAHGNNGTTVGGRVADPDFVRSRAEVAGAPTGGGWMEIFGRAILMARTGGQALTNPNQAEERQVREREAVNRGNLSEAASVCREFLRSPGGLIIDVKSSYSTAADVTAFARAVVGLGINVIAVGSFDRSQLDTVGQVESDGHAVRQVLFFHGLTDLRAAIVSAQARQLVGAQNAETLRLDGSDSVMFNAGSLLTTSEEEGAPPRYSIEQSTLQALMVAKRDLHGGSMGLYVQEPAVSPAAIELITVLTNSRSDLFNLGFAHGNVSGVTESRTQGTGHGNQRYLDW